jgi:enoyl-CoA hydratase/carnithine racemase
MIRGDPHTIADPTILGYVRCAAGPLRFRPLHACPGSTSIESRHTVAYDLLIYEMVDDGIVRITLNRPESLNAVNTALLKEIYAASAEATADPNVAVIIYRGAGRAFSVGRDFKETGDRQPGDPAGRLPWRAQFRGFGPQTWLNPKATIAQVHGYAIGGGFDLAVECDLTIASMDARFGYPEARYGTLTADLHAWNWLMSPKTTKEYALTGRNLSADEAQRFGLVNKAVSVEDLESTVLALARDMVAMERRNPGFIRANKFQINASHHELMTLSVINPYRVEAAGYVREFINRSTESQQAFFTKVAEEGFQSAVDDMHEGFSSRT